MASTFYSDCTRNVTLLRQSTCYLQLFECSDASCNDYLTSPSLTYCPNATSCTTLCSQSAQSNICQSISSSSFISAQPFTHSICSIHCGPDDSPKACKLNKYYMNPIATDTALPSTDNQHLVIRLNANSLWTITVLSMICVFGCVICCIARIFWNNIQTNEDTKKDHEDQDRGSDHESSSTTVRTTITAVSAVSASSALIEMDRNGPHIINDDESYMHSLTLAQVEHEQLAKHKTISNPFRTESHTLVPSTEDDKNIAESLKVQITPRPPINPIDDQKDIDPIIKTKEYDTSVSNYLSHIKTCKSSTLTETFYYKENEKNVEHHILMPALDEKDSAEIELEEDTRSNRKKRLNTLSIRSLTNRLEYRTSDEDVLEDHHSFT
eukprot:241583_1